MAMLGFDGNAIDYVDCPEALKWFLQSDVKLHRVVGGISFYHHDGCLTFLSQSL